MSLRHSADYIRRRLLARSVVDEATGCREWGRAKRGGYGRLWDGERVVEVKVDYRKVKGTLSLTFAKDATPLGAAWVFGDASGKVRFTHWRQNAVADESVFDAPAGLPRKEVRQEDLLRMFASVFEFAVEATE